jgi:UBX domain-containing protein 11
MESFLNDYGLVWVGQSDNGGAPGDSYRGFDLALDYDVLKARVAELNALAGAETGSKRVVTRGGVSRLEEAEMIPMTVWKNGFMLWRGPFREVDSELAQTFLRDVLDGYFPSELKERYPQGVQIKLVDKTDSAFDDSIEPPSSFAGPGRSLQGSSDAEANPPRAAAVGGASKALKVSSLASIGDPDMELAAPMSKEQFLGALPESVMARGRVIKLREGVGDLLGASSASERPDVVIARTPVVDALRTDTPLDATFRVGGGEDSVEGVDPAEVTTLQVRSDSGKQTLVVKLRGTDTVGDLKAYVDKYRSKQGDYDLVTAFPRRAYTDLSQTLQEAGLFPNAKLLIRVAMTTSASSSE